MASKMASCIFCKIIKGKSRVEAPKLRSKLS